MKGFQVIFALGLISLVAAQSSSKYSLQNMPRTSFTCRDKILGGYYADSETNCQMFHICVKVAGVGIQDFRFLCPNNTAFDQEAQICADWGDVDCESATLYYGSDNFDLYRIGSTFESKRAPFAEEDESVFHLQRAETSDARRSKQYIVNQNNQNNLQHIPQKQHSVQPPRPTTTFTPPTQKQTTVSTTTLRPAFEQTRIIAASTYRPSVAPKSTFAEKTTAAYKVSNNNNNNNNDFFKHQKTSDVNDDEILKESQSAHFYNNRNNGKEDFDEDYSRSTKAPALPAKQKLRGRQRGRSKFRGDTANAVTSAQVKSTVTIVSTSTQRTYPTEQQRQTFTNSPIVVQQSTTSNSRFNYDNFRTNQNASTTLQASNNYRSTSPSPAPFSQTPAQSTRQASVVQSTTQDSTFFDVPKVNQKSAQNQYKAAPQNIDYNTQSTTGQPQQQNRFNVIPQRVIVPNNLSPQHRLALQASNNNFQSTAASSPSSSTTESSQFVPQYSRTNNPINQRQNEQKPQVQAQQQSKDFSKSTPQKFNFKTQKYESAEPLHPTTQFYNPNYETKGTDSNFGNLELTRNNNKTYAARQLTTSSLDDVNRPTTFNPQQFYQNQQYQQPQQSQQQLPRGFSAAQKSTPAPHTQQSQTTPQQPKRKTPQPDSRYQTIARTEGRDQHTPSTHKKFSTLVPKENYNPTTFKPSTYSKKPVDHIASQKLEKVQNPNKYYTQFVTSPAPTTVTVPSTTTQQPQQPQQNFNNYQQNQNQNNFFSSPLQKQSQQKQSQQKQQNELQQNRQQTNQLQQNNQQNNQQQQQQQNNQQQQQNLQNRQSNFFSSTTTARPLAENEEDDGQYRPELYEKDFYRNKAKTSKAPAVPRGSINNNNNNNYNNFFQTTTKTTTLRPFNQNNNNNHNSNHYNSAEDEFLKTAHSQNIAASGNELRAEKERARQQAKFNDYTTTVNEKSSPRPFSKPTTTPSTTTISHRAVTTSRPSKKVEKDVSYDYQYYDTHNENNDYTEYGAAEDFGKTSKKSN